MNVQLTKRVYYSALLSLGLMVALPFNLYAAAEPITGRIETLKVSASSTAFEGGGTLEITLKGVKETFTLNKYYSSNQDNTPFMASYDLALNAYINQWCVTIENLNGDPGPTFKGFSISISESLACN